jgi:hypothetical protein
MYGIFLFALLIDYVHQRMRPSSFQITALEWILNLRLEEKEREEAARLIQIVYKQYKWKKLNELLGKMVENERNPFGIAFLKQQNVTRRIRKYVVQIMLFDTNLGRRKNKKDNHTDLNLSRKTQNSRWRCQI